ncbi:reverse transcriptase domain-containing protein [Tanacetum coccineum]|uniref:Reverse transcriptase domain-containing protein n=1 Tax=Tanacetum coccineum TaxID=301880 RepID=A0ABQ5GTJ4_9ASTR
MRTRSSSNLVGETSTNPKRRNRRRSKQIIEPFSLEETPVVTMADQRTMAELLQAPTEGYGDAIVIPAILAENFELKHGLLNLVTSKQFYGFEKEDPHAHIRWFNKITSTINFTELIQLDTFYNALTPIDQDSLNAAAGVSTNAPSSSTPYFPKIAALADAVKAMLLQKSSPPASVKAVEDICVACGGRILTTNGSLPSNTVANPRGDLKAITTRSGISYNEPPIPTPSPLLKEVECETEATKDTVELHFELSLADALLQMLKFASMFKILLNNKENLFELAKTPIVECLALANLGASINLIPLSIWKKLSLPELTPTQMILELADRSTTSPSVDDEAITFKVGQTSRYSYNDTKLVNRIDVIDISCEEYAQEVLGFSDSSTSSNPTPSLDHILSTSFPSLTPFEGGDFNLEEMESCLTNDSIPPRIDDADFDPEGDLLLLEKLLNDDPSSPLPPKELHFEGIKMIKSSIDDPLELELKDLQSHLKYAFLEGTDKLPVIISKELKDEEKDDLKPTVQHQRRVNPKILEVIKKEVVKLLDARLIYPISDSPWVSPVHCEPKKGDYRKLNDATRKDHFPLSFMDQMLKRLAGNEYYCFLEGFSGYFQIPIDSQDQENTTFTCPYRMFAYRRMPFGLCNAPGTFQWCMMAIFHDMIEETMEVFMDNFLVFGDSFSSCLSHLIKCLNGAKTPT